MGLDEELRELQQRYELLSEQKEKLVTDGAQVDTDLKAVSQRIRDGETTGDDIRDYVLANGNMISKGRTITETVEDRVQSLKEKVDRYVDGGIYLLQGYRAGKVVLVDNPHYKIPKDYSSIQLQIIDGVSIRTQRVSWFNVDIPYLDTIKTGAINIANLSASVAKKGWADIKHAYDKQPELLAHILVHFNQEISDDILYRSQVEEDERTINIIKQLDERVRNASRLWEQIEQKRKKREELQRKQSGMKGAPVLGIRDQLQRDQVDIELDMMIFKGPSRHDHDNATRGLVQSLKQAVEIGLHNYRREVSIEHRPGKNTVYDVAKYVRAIAGQLEVLYAPVETE
jgi:hypothetical protein